MVAQSSIVTGAASVVAELILDPAAVRGTGGVAGPMLEIPLTITMPGRSQLVLGIESMQVELWASASMTSAGFRLAGPDTIMGIGGSTSMSAGPMGSRHQTTARFGLSSGQVAALADHAEKALPSPVELVLHVRARCVAVVNADLADDVGDGRSFLLGAVRLAIIEGTRPTELRFAIPREQWAESIMPGLGADAVRLIPIAFPRSEDGPGNSGERFDEARKHLDSGRWREAVRSCRDVRHAVERELGASKDQRVFAVSAAQRRLDPSALAFLDSTWAGFAELTNQASHEKTGDLDYLPIGRAEAQAAVRLTAVLISYLRGGGA